VGAAATDERASFCGGSATEISGGQQPTKVAGNPFETTLCDLAHPELNPPHDDGPPRVCLNKLGNSCAVCCPTTTPDCSHPDDYPAYGCTPGPSSFCSCGCQNGAWSCGC